MGGVVGFDVNGHIDDTEMGGEKAVFHLMGNDMALANREVAMDDDMDIHGPFEAGLADPAFLDGADAVHVGGQFPYLGNEGIGGGSIHEFVDATLEEADAIEDDDGAGKEGGPVVGGGELGSGEEGDGDADEGGAGGEGIGAMVPGVAFEGGAAQVMADTEDASGEECLDEDDEGENGQGEPGGGFMGIADFVEALPGDPAGSPEEEEGNDNAGEGFGFAMAVGVAMVGRA